MVRGFNSAVSKVNLLVFKSSINAQKYTEITNLNTLPGTYVRCFFFLQQNNAKRRWKTDWAELSAVLTCPLYAEI